MTREFNNRETVDLRLLVSFVAVAQVGSITGAADQLGYVPSAVSQHVSALERSLGGTNLFARNPNGLTLTAVGRALADAAESLFAATTDFSDAARRISAGEGIQIRLGAYGSALSHLLTRALLCMAETGNRPSIRAFEVEPSAGMPEVEMGRLDVLMAHRYLPDDPVVSSKRLQARSLGWERMDLSVSTDSSADERTVDSCRTADWVAGGPGVPDRRMLTKWATAVGFAPNVVFETEDCHTAVEIISSGLAVGFLPASVVAGRAALDRLSVVPVPPEQHEWMLRREVFAITRCNATIPALESLLAELARGVEPYAPATARSAVADEAPRGAGF